MSSTVDDRVKRALERGPVSSLELDEEDLAELSVAQTRTMHKKVAFLRAFALRGIVLDGCEVAGCSRFNVKYWREDEWFEAMFQAAMEESGDRIEAEAMRRAMHGIDEPVIYQGLPTMLEDADTGAKKMLTTKKYSDQLLALMLKGRKPDVYRENISAKVEHTGQTGVLIVPGAIDPTTWAEQAAAQQAKYAGSTGGKDGA